MNLKFSEESIAGRRVGWLSVLNFQISLRAYNRFTNLTRVGRIITRVPLEDELPQLLEYYSRRSDRTTHAAHILAQIIGSVQGNVADYRKKRRSNCCE